MNTCDSLHKWTNSLPAFRFPFDAFQIPSNGIYFLFEKGEVAHGVNRIVRVGTHTGNNQLQSRLRQHFLAENKDRSIFRKNIGRALLNRELDPFLAFWEVDLTSRLMKQRYIGADLDKQKETERRVSIYIRDNFSFVVVRIDDKAQRLMLESKLISTVSLCQGCKPSDRWLGLFSPKPKIRESGLWLVNELYKEPLSDSELEGLIRSAEGVLLGQHAS